MKQFDLIHNKVSMFNKQMNEFSIKFNKGLFSSHFSYFGVDGVEHVISGTNVPTSSLKHLLNSPQVNERLDKWLDALYNKFIVLNGMFLSEDSLKRLNEFTKDTYPETNIMVNFICSINGTSES